VLKREAPASWPNIKRQLMQAAQEGGTTITRAARTSGSVRLSVMLVTAPAQSLGEIPSVGGMVHRT
jgi:hypothetical protein